MRGLLRLFWMAAASLHRFFASRELRAAEKHAEKAAKYEERAR